MLGKLLFVIALCLVALSVQAAIPDHNITNLPGFGVPYTPMYSGWIAADAAQTVFLHYWFVQASDVDSTTAPVVVWMNGGPGCSSLGGFLFENGPFTFNNTVDPKSGLPYLSKNTNAWSTLANMLYIEHPIGVGFSYAVNGSVSSDDYTQSQNTYGFLLNFFKYYSEYAKNEFFITGESYAGIYVPTLANRILLGNQAGNSNINLVGFAVGNGCIGNAVGTCGNDPRANKYLIDDLFGHGMVAQDLYYEIEAACEPYSNISNQCNNLLSQAENAAGNFNIYNVYDVCGNDSPTTAKRTHAPNPFRAERLGDPVVCIPSAYGPTYLDNPDVRKAIHMDNSTLQTWEDCAGINYNSNLVSLLPTYPALIKNYRVLIYSGDADACVPWNGSEEWTRLMNYTVSNDWHPWTYNSQYLGGFATQYGTNFAYVTIRHAGHLVPQYEPEAALQMFKTFLTSNVY